MIEKFTIAGYCRISVDEEQDRDNTSKIGRAHV